MSSGRTAGVTGVLSLQCRAQAVEDFYYTLSVHREIRDALRGLVEGALDKLCNLRNK